MAAGAGEMARWRNGLFPGDFSKDGTGGEFVSRPEWFNNTERGAIGLF